MVYRHESASYSWQDLARTGQQGCGRYGILPELLPHAQLARGNSILELFTFLAILTGTTAGGFLLAGAGAQPWLAPLTLTILALIGFAAAWAVPPVPAARAAGGLFDTIHGALSALRADRQAPFRCTV